MIRLLRILGIMLPAVLLAQGQTAFEVATFDKTRVIKSANEYLKEKPITITASSSPRSAGGKHDFFSEGDYWWQNPDDQNGAYIQRDGMSNPDNFVDHRRYLMRLSVEVPALTAAWMISKDSRYAKKAAEHLRAWFLDEETRMNPNLQFAQAIKGITTGRGVGVIDTIHLVEVAKSIEILENSKTLKRAETDGIKKWFSDYLQWMTTSKNGLEEREAKNNHGTCWVMQVAAFAHLTGNKELLEYCGNRYKTVLVPNQIENDGGFPQELRRTKPYGYSLFNLEAFAVICQILSISEDNLWKFETTDGRGIGLAIKYMFPFIKDKKTWTRPPDVMYDKEFPMRQNSLLFSGIALNQPEYVEVWKTLPPDSNVEEVIRNFFIRQPILWIKSSEFKRGTHLAKQIEPDGKQPLELARTKSWSYSTMNLEGMATLAELGDVVGVDLWNFKTADGRGIRKTIEFLYPFAASDKKWTFEQIEPFESERLWSVMRRAALRYKDEPFQEMMSRVPKLVPDDAEFLFIN